MKKKNTVGMIFGFMVLVGGWGLKASDGVVSEINNVPLKVLLSDLENRGSFTQYPQASLHRILKEEEKAKGLEEEITVSGLGFLGAASVASLALPGGGPFLVAGYFIGFFTSVYTFIWTTDKAAFKAEKPRRDDHKEKLNRMIEKEKKD